jgi:hypothetical protein
LDDKSSTEPELAEAKELLSLGVKGLEERFRVTLEIPSTKRAQHVEGPIRETSSGKFVAGRPRARPRPPK